MGVLKLTLCTLAAVLALALGGRATASGAAAELNAGKYGATLYWWYETLPGTTLYPPTVRWDARDRSWWNAVVRQSIDAGLGWLTPGSWGEGSNADPATLGPLVAAIEESGSRLKIALFDDTTSEVLRKNERRGYGWITDVRFDLADMDGRGEGGFAYFYDQQWKRFFQTVPARHRLTVNGRPVVFMWHGGAEWYANQNFFHAMVDALRLATRRDFGVDPFVIVEESWLRLDPATNADASYDWFEPGRTIGTLMTQAGFRVGLVYPGYDCSRCGPGGPVVPRQNGLLYQAALQAVAADADLVLIESINNVDENAHLMESGAWGRLYLSLTKWFSIHLP